MNFSVLMSVYDGDSVKHLFSALQSLQQQTLLAKEVVLVEDGKVNDDIKQIISQFKHSLNIVSVKLDKNYGLAYALNQGLIHCKYELVARMDSDDIALPFRFERQVGFMVDNTDVAAVSSYVEEFNDNNHNTHVRCLPTKHTDIVKFSKMRSPLSHPATVFRKNIILSVGGYPNFRKAQDYALWSLLIVNGFKLANIPNVLVRMRTGNDLFNRRGFSYFKGELEIMRFQKKIGHLSTFRFISNTVLRFFIRCSPNNIKSFFYSLR